MWCGTQFFGNPTAGYRILVNGHAEIVGETAAATPFWAGAVAVISSSLGRNLGYFNSVLFSEARITAWT